MKTLSCSFCGEPLQEVRIKQGEEHFCSSRHRGHWNHRSDGYHQLLRLHHRIIGNLSGRQNFADQHYG